MEKICEKCNCGDPENYPCQFGANPNTCNHIPSEIMISLKNMVNRYKKIICDMSMCDSMMDDDICERCEFNKNNYV